MRIDKYLSSLKFGSRQDIKKMIKQKSILINEICADDPGQSIRPETDEIKVDDLLIPYFKAVHLMIYKPKGYLSANHDQKHPCVTDLIKNPFQRYDFKIAGRLDIDTEGLLILTTDGTLVHQITHPKKHLNKVYEAELDKPFEHEKALYQGVRIKDGKNESYLAQALSISYSDKHVLITIDEGKFHQVKRMFLEVGYTVLSLKRLQIGMLKLGGLEPGTYREFQPEELYD